MMLALVFSAFVDDFADLIKELWGKTFEWRRHPET